MVALKIRLFKHKMVVGMSSEIVIDRGSASISLTDAERALMNEIEIEPPPPTEARTLPKKKPMVPNFRRAPQQQQRARDEPDMDAFVNPTKIREQTYQYGPEGGEEEFPMGEDEFEDMGPGGGGGGGPGPQMPSEGFATIEDEKAALLTKIERLKKKGIASTQKLHAYSDIEEIRTEYKRMMYSVEVEQATKFARRMLVACCTGIEFLNKRFDPFDVQLEGWSETVMENIEDYDGVFEELHNKYKTKVQMAPELKLVMMVGGSAMMFHLTNSMFKSAFPSMNQVVRQNPDLVKNMVDAISKTQQQQQGAPSAGGGGGRHEMKGPGIDLGSLLGGFMPPPPPVSTQPERVKVPVVIEDDPSDAISDIVSEPASESTKDISTTGGRRRTKKKEVTL